ncbi:hypothetical protein O6H91_01G092100 [Diphasiastrum complanatum]|nr:hypothetical protein O6H91_01G092100 [Diphasiastrum complanatum]
MWKRIYRKLKAETKQVHIACCEGICWPTETVHYNTFTYEKNFDSGREYWQQHDSVSGKASSGNLWKEDSDMSEIALKSSSRNMDDFHSGGSSPWQRRKISSPSQLQGKKVWFAD